MTDSLILSKDGTITIVAVNQRWKLRRPTLGELRKLHETWNGSLDVIRAEGASPADEERAVLGWIQETIRALATEGHDLSVEPFEITDDLPPWMVNGSIANQFITHWRTLPLASGA